ncbi:NTF2 fold immunity protein [Pseudomonas luteola]|uniref:NTF2 fold immunity protein n=1 Tax=Pseudomonas luteola TaxID=47886 RepID=UPI00289C6E36|nr:NTF2 fold immunity protein [Pseudomonas luteola]
MKTETSKQVLIDFLTRMHHWEDAFYHKQEELDENGEDDSETVKEYKKQLEAIFEEFTINDSKNSERIIDMGCTFPTTYNPNDKIIPVEINNNEAVYLVEQSTGFKSTFRFTLTKSKETWFILKKERLTHNTTWARSTI